MVDRPLAAHDLSQRLALLVEALDEPERSLEARALLRLTSLLRLASRGDLAADLGPQAPGRRGSAWGDLLGEALAWRRGDIPSWRGRPLALAAGAPLEDAGREASVQNGNLSTKASIDVICAHEPPPGGALDWDRALDLLRQGAPDPATLLGALLGARAQRRRRGTFHTPVEASRHLIRLLGAHGDGGPVGEGPGALVVDPAVGGGALVLAWLHEAIARRITGGITGETTAPDAPQEKARCAARLIRENIRAFDRDPLAVEATRAALLEAAFPELGPDDEALERIAVADALAEPMPGPLAEAFAEATTLLINPPWASFSGRERQAKPAAKGVRQAPSRGQGWPALHTRFVQRCVDACSPGVQAGLVLPAQVAGLPGYGSFREQYASRVRSVTPLGEGVFPGVTSPTVLVTLGATTGAPLRLSPPPAPPENGDGAHETRGEAGVRPGEGQLRRSALSKDPSRPWTRDPPDLQAGWPPPGFRLVHGAFGDRGIHSGNAARRLFSAEPRPGDVPVLVGADLRAYGTPRPSLWLDPKASPRAGEYFRLGDLEGIRRVPFLLRQTADRPIAALNPGLPFRNSVLAGFGVPGLPKEICLAILNSPAAARIHRALAFDAGQRAFPQVKISQLRRFPWPLPLDAGLEASLAKGARDAQAAIKGGDRSLAAATIAVIDGLVDGLYAPVLSLLS